ncbi:hypothetical protein BJV74DRAFT_890326 [Russula compacta]|nr:hypothetical protein BJV74DRAFT_890326 [Russula compacta]
MAFSSLAVFGSWKNAKGVNVWLLKRIKISIFLTLALDVAQTVPYGTSMLTSPNNILDLEGQPTSPPLLRSPPESDNALRGCAIRYGTIGDCRSSTTGPAPRPEAPDHVTGKPSTAPLNHSPSSTNALVATSAVIAAPASSQGPFAPIDEATPPEGTARSDGSAPATSTE